MPALRVAAAVFAASVLAVALGYVGAALFIFIQLISGVRW